jgi:Fe-S cluster assembly scaffold protein SufB
MLEIEAAGVAHVVRGRHRDRARAGGVRFEPLVDHPLLGTLVGSDEKFAAHNAARWEHGLLVHVPKGVVVEQPLYVRIANSVPGGSLFWRLLVVAEPESRFTVIEEYASADPGLEAYSNAGRRDRRRGGREGRVRVGAEPLARTWHFASHHARVERDAELDWVAGGFGSSKGKIRIQNDLAGPGATSRVTGAYFADGTQHLDYDTFQEHIAPHTTSDFAVQGRARDTATAVWRGMIRVEKDAQKTNAYQENRNLLLSPHGARGLDPRPRDPRQRRALHPRRDARPGRPRAALLPDGARALPCRGGAADRARVLPGRARPDRARARARCARGRARGAHPQA